MKLTDINIFEFICIPVYVVLKLNRSQFKTFLYFCAYFILPLSKCNEIITCLFIWIVFRSRLYLIDLLSSYLVSLVVSLTISSNFYQGLICVIHTNFASISIGLLILYSCLTNCMNNFYYCCCSNYSVIFFCNPSHDVLLLQPHYTNSLGRND